MDGTPYPNVGGVTSPPPPELFQGVLFAISLLTIGEIESNNLQSHRLSTVSLSIGEVMCLGLC